MTIIDALRISNFDAQQIHEDETAYRAALPRYLVVSGSEVLTATNGWLAFSEGRARNATVLDRHNLHESVIAND